MKSERGKNINDGLGGTAIVLNGGTLEQVAWFRYLRVNIDAVESTEAGWEGEHRFCGV